MLLPYSLSKARHEKSGYKLHKVTVLIHQGYGKGKNEWKLLSSHIKQQLKHLRSYNEAVIISYTSNELQIEYDITSADSQSWLSSDTSEIEEISIKPFGESSITSSETEANAEFRHFLLICR